MSNRIQYQQWLSEVQNTVGESFQLLETRWENALQRMEARESSWIVKIVSVIGGFMATQFFLGFILIGGITESPIALSIIGTLLIAGALFAMRKVDLLIADTMAVCSYLTGFVLLALAFNIWHWSLDRAALAGLLVALVTLLFIRHTIMAFFAIAIVMGCGLFLYFHHPLLQWIQLWPAGLGLALVFLYEKEAVVISFLRRFIPWYRPLLMVIALVFIGMLQLLGKRHQLKGLGEDFSYVSVFLLILLLRVVYQILPQLQVQTRQLKTLIVLVVGIIFLPTLISPAIVGIFLLMLLSFRAGDRWIWVLSIFAGIVFIAEYYYDLDYTLLTKSYILMGSGTGFLLLYYFTRQKWNLHEME
jgi:uncharacterized membrane protein